jgi:nucleotide-binding universal stress UspA family protein
MANEAMKVLLAIDGSGPSLVAVQLVANVAWPAGTEIVVAKALPAGPDLFGGPWPAVAALQADQIEADIRDQAEQTVRDARERLTQPGLNVEAAVLSGRPATALAARARAMHADVVIVGSRGHGTIESMLLGSVSAEVVDHAPAPVLVARGSRIEEIVLAWDGSTGAARAADLVRTWPIFARCHVRVVSVADVAIPWWTGFPVEDSPELRPIYEDAADASREEHSRLAQEMAADLQAAGLRAEADVRDGDPAAGLLAAADNKADLIVMGTHGRTGLERVLLGSVARNILQHAPCSVLVVRERSTPVRPPGGNLSSRLTNL